MAGDFDTVIKGLLSEALPQLYAGASPPVTAGVRDEGLELSPADSDGDVEPRREDRFERLPVDPAAPTGPHEVAVRPADRAIVRLVSDGATVATLRDEEVIWDPGGEPRFTIAPAPGRDLAAVDELQVLYAVTAVATRLRGVRTASLVLSGEQERLTAARALTVAVVSLESPRLVAEARDVHEQDGWTSTETIRSLEVVDVPAAGSDPEVRLRLHVDLELRRAIRPDEGVPISSILTPGAAGKGPVTIEPRVDA